MERQLLPTQGRAHRLEAGVRHLPGLLAMRGDYSRQTSAARRVTAPGRVNFSGYLHPGSVFDPAPSTA
ncbi:hypothetical protein D3C72_2138930 [compost metagenome]